jgi:hypothetical protein
MAIWNGSFVCHSFKKELFEAKHDFLVHVFKLALYTDQAELTNALLAYTSEGEVPPLNGYTTGGQAVGVQPPIVSEGVALVDFDDVTWPASAITARGAMCYNASAPGFPALFVLDFGANRISNAGDFTVRFPDAILKVV